MYPIIAAIVFVHPVPIALMHGSAPADAPAAKVYLTKLLMAICGGANGSEPSVQRITILLARAPTHSFCATRLTGIDEIDIGWREDLHQANPVEEEKDQRRTHPARSEVGIVTRAFSTLSSSRSSPRQTSSTHPV